jgi:hypothetical protein
MRSQGLKLMSVCSGRLEPNAEILHGGRSLLLVAIHSYFISFILNPSQRFLQSSHKARSGINILGLNEQVVSGRSDFYEIRE